MNHKFFLTWISFLIAFSSVYAQEDYNHTELEWRTIETQHFLVHFHQGTERTAHEVALIAESIYDPITKMYNHEPDQRVSFVICDYDDYSNGGAYFYDNKIEIWASALDFELRGTHPWLWNVVTHEFTHIVQIQTTMKFGRKVPGIYLQWLGYEAERRPDVLYGYPNVLVSYPISGFVVPPWFAEGVAQYSNPKLGYDTWDSHRDMIFRMYMIEGEPLSWEEMACFGKTSLGSESVYNAGFSLVGYIGQKYGVEKLQEISRKLASPSRLTIDGAIEASLGETGVQLYEEWRAEKKVKYQRLADSLKSTRREGEVIEEEGFGNFYPVFSPDGSKIAYISNKGEDYFSTSSVYLYDRTTKQAKIILPRVRSSLSFSPDGRYLYYARITRNNAHWSAYSDLFRYDMIAEREERLTHGLRALSPKLSLDGKKIVFAFGGDGTLNIGECDKDGQNIRKLTQFKDGEQAYTPVWSPHRKKIAFGYSIGHNQSIALIDSDGTNLQLLQQSGDSRNPFFASDSMLYFSWDDGGIFNIYSMNLKSSIERKITNVFGGAFLPTFDTTGNLAYVTYTSTGYKIAFMHCDSINQSLPRTISLSLAHDSIIGNSKEEVAGGTIAAYSSKIQFSDSSPGTNISNSSKPYRSVFTSLSLIPLIRIDNYNEHNSGIDIIKPGLYFTSGEVLDKMDIFGGGAINRRLESDLFLIFEYHDRLPLLYQLGLEPSATVELYNITRSINYSFDLYGYELNHITTTVDFNLFEFDLSLRQPLFTENNKIELRYTLSKYNQDFGSWVYPYVGVIPASRSTYLISNIFLLQLKHDGILPTIDKDINPLGRSVSLKYSYEMNAFNPTDTTEDKNGFRVPVYKNFDFHRLELNWNEHFSMPIQKHTLTFGLTAGGIVGKTVDEFFDFYGGGFIGMRGYPFYAIGGNELAIMNVNYRFPIATKLDFRLLQFYFTKLFASVFYDIGDAWSGQTPSIVQWKKDIGFELRLESFSFYAYPTRIFFSGAYGLDKFPQSVNNGVQIQTVTYGHEWRFYLGILFGFELNDDVPNKFRR